MTNRGCSRNNCTKFTHHYFATVRHRAAQFSAKCSERNCLHDRGRYLNKGKGKGVCSYLWKSISQLRSVTCHMGSHSVTFHPIQANIPRLYHSPTGWYSIYQPIPQLNLLCLAADKWNIWSENKINSKIVTSNLWYKVLNRVRAMPAVHSLAGNSATILSTTQPF